MEDISPRPRRSGGSAGTSLTRVQLREEELLYLRSILIFPENVRGFILSHLAADPCEVPRGQDPSPLSMGSRSERDRHPFGRYQLHFELTEQIPRILFQGIPATVGDIDDRVAADPQPLRSGLQRRR